jgi:hypothetical protein
LAKPWREQRWSLNTRRCSRCVKLLLAWMHQQCKNPKKRNICTR